MRKNSAELYYNFSILNNVSTRKKAHTLPHLLGTIRYLWGICPFSFFSKILYTIFQPAVLPQQPAPCFSIVIFDNYSLFSLYI